MNLRTASKPTAPLLIPDSLFKAGLNLPSGICKNTACQRKQAVFLLLLYNLFYDYVDSAVLQDNLCLGAVFNFTGYDAASQNIFHGVYNEAF